MSAATLSPAWLRDNGFTGSSTIDDLRSRRAVVPGLPGVYIVYRDQLNPAEFLDRSTGGWFKGRDPSVPIGKLEASWVEEAHVLYIGKADSGRTGTRGVRVRVDEYLRFGHGEPIGHWGGRYLWQLADVDELLICWKPCSDPADEEARLLDLFRAAHDALPFANLRSGSRSKRKAT